jgi:protein TonB
VFVPTLLETRRPLASRGSFGGGAASFAIHSALIAAVVYASLNVNSLEQVGRLIVDLPAFQQTAPPPPPAVATVVAPPAAFSTIAIPTDIPTVLPPPSTVAFDPTRFTGIGVEAASPWSRDTATHPTVRRESVYAIDVLEELPERIGGDEPRYPELLRKAGIGGQVRVEFVIDTAGRVENGSVRILASTHELFSAAARAAVSTWLFRPGRIAEAAVRSRVQVPLGFLR